MANEVFSAAGRRLDIEVRRGLTLGPIPHMIAHEDETPFDMTGYVYRGSVQSYVDPTLVVPFDFDTARVADGIYKFGLTDEKTLLLKSGDGMYSRDSLHRYQVEMESPAGKVTQLIYGEIRVIPSIALT